MAAVDDVTDRPDGRLRMADQHHRPHPLEVDLGDLLALPQVAQRRRPLFGGDPVGDAAARAAMVEAENQARILWRAAVDKGIDAERTVRAEQAGRHLLDEFKARTPDQRPITEYPEVFIGVIEGRIH